MNKERVVRGTVRITALTGLVFSAYTVGWLDGKTDFKGAIHPQEKCTGLVFESSLIGEAGFAGETFPVTLDGSLSVILLDPEYAHNSWVLAHEAGHVQQACEITGILHIARYSSSEEERRKIELDANRRADKILSDQKLAGLRAEIEEIIKTKK